RFDVTKPESRRQSPCIKLRLQHVGNCLRKVAHALLHQLSIHQLIKGSVVEQLQHLLRRDPPCVGGRVRHCLARDWRGESHNGYSSNNYTKSHDPCERELRSSPATMATPKGHISRQLP